MHQIPQKSNHFSANGTVTFPFCLTNGGHPRNVSQGDRNSQSEKDWSYAIRKLKAGEDPDKIIRDMTQYRSVDHYDKKDPTKLVAPSKPNPRYYAERTVTQAMAHLGIFRQAPAKTVAGPNTRPAEVEPSR